VTWRCCARRTDRLDELKADYRNSIRRSRSRWPRWTCGTKSRCRRFSRKLSDELDGIDRIIVNAGIGSGAPAGIRQALGEQEDDRDQPGRRTGSDRDRTEMFHKSGSGHLVLISSVLGNKGVPGIKAAYCASNEGDLAGRIAARRIRQRPHQGSRLMEPGYIESEDERRSRRAQCCWWTTKLVSGHSSRRLSVSPDSAVVPRVALGAAGAAVCGSCHRTLTNNASP